MEVSDRKGTQGCGSAGRGGERGTAESRAIRRIPDEVNQAALQHLLRYLDNG